MDYRQVLLLDVSVEMASQGASRLVGSDLHIHV